MMTISEVIKALQSMVDNDIISPECEFGVRDVINDLGYEIIGYDVYMDGSLNLKVREK